MGRFWEIILESHRSMLRMSETRRNLNNYFIIQNNVSFHENWCWFVQKNFLYEYMYKLLKLVWYCSCISLTSFSLLNSWCECRMATIKKNINILFEFPYQVFKETSYGCCIANFPNTQWVSFAGGDRKKGGFWFIYHSNSFPIQEIFWNHKL